MRADIHPDYRLVVFQDTSAGTSFLTRSSAPAKETVESMRSALACPRLAASGGNGNRRELDLTLRSVFQ